MISKQSLEFLTHAHLRGVYRLRKQDITEGELSSLKRTLTVQSKYEESTPIELWSENGEWLEVPRFFGLERWGLFLENNLNDISFFPTTTNSDQEDGISEPQFIGELTDKQAEVVNEVIVQFNDETNIMQGGIVQCPTGFGKTVLMLAIFIRMGFKALITVHNEVLFKNILEGCKKFLKGVSIGTIQGGKINYDEHKDHMCLAMIQSLVSEKSRISEFIRDECKFGLWMCDEMQHVAAETFTRLRSIVCARYCLGFSATPIRNDGLTHVLHWIMGPIIVTVPKNWNRVHIHMLNYHPTEERYRKEIPKGKSLNFGAMLTQLSLQKDRNSKIISELVHHFLNPHPLKDRKRKTLILSDRTSHLEKLAEQLNNYLLFLWKDEKNATSSFILDKGYIITDNNGNVCCRIGFIMGSEIMNKTTTGDKKRKTTHKPDTSFAEDCDFIFATWALGGEGLNIPRIDTVLEATPRSHPEQHVGRALRVHPQKNEPLYLYIWDDYSYYKQIGWSARRYFTGEKGFHLTTRFLGDFI